LEDNNVIWLKFFNNYISRIDTSLIVGSDTLYTSNSDKASITSFERQNIARYYLTK
jgi:hypothetical protein